jgi:aspartyl/glutamyl-tRNA(Asn/Gln) amidotransferase C subunit
VEDRVTDERPAPTIDEATVAHVARLGRLELTAEERELFRAQLGSILESFRRLAELDLDGVDPAVHVGSAAGAMRDDVVVASLPREQALANAPAVAMGLVYQSSAHSIGILYQNAVQAQRNASICAQAATNQGVVQLYSVGTMAGAMATKKLARRTSTADLVALLHLARRR